MNASSPDSSRNEEIPSPEERSLSPILQAFQEKIAAFPTPEEKVAFGLQFMRSSISQEGTPRFKEFWEARKQLLPFFKENLNPAIRSRLWDEYVELTVEARRLKEILEEQSAFAMEQIDLAIQAIETDLGRMEELKNSAELLAVPEGRNREFYAQIQTELGLFNTLASRLNALRKEVMKTDMRIRFKTKLFKRLSSLGDQVFPKRKELIERLSQAFEKDVEQFATDHFQGGQVVGAPYYALREEIKALQGMAKLFTLSSSAFHRTREKLSSCWDQIRELEKEHKKEALEKRQQQQEERAEKDKVAIEAAERARKLAEEQREILRLKKEKVEEIKKEMQLLQEEGERIALEAFEERFLLVSKQVAELDLSKMEKQQLERRLRPVHDLLVERKERSLINLSDDDRKIVQNLHIVLEQKKERRQEIKELLEGYRKQLGGSNLDFEKAIYLRELIDQEKERLEKANSAIEEIEEKIASLEHPE